MANITEEAVNALIGLAAGSRELALGFALTLEQLEQTDNSQLEKTLESAVEALEDMQAKLRMVRDELLAARPPYYTPMSYDLLFEPKHFRCPFCGLRCVAGVVAIIGTQAIIHELPVCPQSEAAGPAVTLARVELEMRQPLEN